VPENIKRTFDRLGIPEAERKFLAGVGAQYDSEVVYHSLREEWEKLGVIFLDMDAGCASTKTWCASTSPPSSRLPTTSSPRSTARSGAAAALSTCPKGVHVDIPLQAYFRINAQNMGQFERTLIIVEEGASVHYVEGCTAPIYSSNSLHSAVVEIIVKKGARCRYTTIQNWSTDVYNLVTKRAVAYEGATMEWIDGNLGSKVTMKYPGRLHARPQGPRRNSVDRLCRQGPAPGRRRQGRPRRAFHQLQDRLQVDLQGRRPRLLSRSAQGGQGRTPQQEQRRLRRAAAG
jgi:Fe-S cluster assembly protein SufB